MQCFQFGVEASDHLASEANSESSFDLGKVKSMGSHVLGAKIRQIRVLSVVLSDMGGEMFLLLSFSCFFPYFPSFPG